VRARRGISERQTAHEEDSGQAQSSYRRPPGTSHRVSTASQVPGFTRPLAEQENRPRRAEASQAPFWTQERARPSNDIFMPSGPSSDSPVTSVSQVQCDVGQLRVAL